MNEWIKLSLPAGNLNFYSLFTQAPLSGGVSAADHTFPSCIADAHYLIPAAVCRPNKSGARRRRGSVWANLLSERLLKAWHPSCCGAAALGRNCWPPLPRSIYSCAQFTSRVCVCPVFYLQDAAVRLWLFRETTQDGFTGLVIPWGRCN